ncbi:hypothetical protein FG386_003434 [Cryptosporidium ryanae]|uniref:uncharacterized protein n=1 Tax=Cryptosporidium ryanae TaxID=515981 RepID=UPI00351AAF3B|nr:hypothetical protein FG386_003434 [Cryptosporidium ryanae]
MRPLRTLLFALLGIALASIRAECRGYRESRINKSVRIETKSMPHVVDSRLNRKDPNTCMVSNFHVTNFLNTARWRRIWNKSGTGWDESLIPPLMFCVKVLDKPTNTSNLCNKNTFDLVIVDGIKTKRSNPNHTVVVASIADVLKGEERCIFVSPCEILRRIYWDDDNFDSPVNRLEFRINVSYESVTTNQRFVAIAGVRGLARSIKSSRNPWDNRMRITQKFKNVQALSLYIPYKPHSKSFISDSCIIKPRVTTVFYGRKKPSVCKFENCMWNIWVGELAGEFVNERCTVGRSSSRGDYIVGWFTPYAIDSDTIGSLRLKIDWLSNNPLSSDFCRASDQFMGLPSMESQSEHSLRSNRSSRSDWFPEETENRSYERIKTEHGEHRNDVGIGSNGETAKQDNGDVSYIGYTTTTTATPHHTVFTNDQTSTSSKGNYKHHDLSEAEILRGKFIINNSGSSKEMGICANGKCTSAKNLWTSCTGEKKRRLTDLNSTESEVGDLNGIDLSVPQVEWIDVDYNSTIYKKNPDGTILYNIDGYINNTEEFFRSISDNVVNTSLVSERVDSSCKHDLICSCMVDGIYDEDITVIEYDEDPDDGQTSRGNGEKSYYDPDSKHVGEFEYISFSGDSANLLRKWLDLKRAHES